MRDNKTIDMFGEDGFRAAVESERMKPTFPTPIVPMTSTIHYLRRYNFANFHRGLKPCQFQVGDRVVVA